MWTITEEGILCWVAQHKKLYVICIQNELCFSKPAIAFTKANIFTMEKIFKVIKKECS